MFVTVSVFLFFFSLNLVYACDADASCMVPDMCLYVRLCQTAVICISVLYIKTLFPKILGQCA